ncbi:MAG: hypothetical protein U0L11_07235 [Acutalibacteraceae bacterium]|nr:hypothetical protein [Acutalibacteraceae bacterium]
MISLIQKWCNENASHDKMLKELIFIINATQNGLDCLFTDTIDDKNTINYCVPCDKNVDTYGRNAGICFSESAAHEAIKEMLNSYALLLLPWFQNDTPSIDLCVKLKWSPVAVIQDENGAEKEIFDALFKFEKCDNKFGFCVRSVIPLLDYKRGDEI